MPDLRWLCLRGGNCYHAIIAVPRKLRPIVGKSHLLRSLHTTDPGVARHRRHSALDDFRLIIDAAARQAAGGEVMRDALEWREHLRRLARGDGAAFRGYDHVPETDRAAFAYSHARMLAEEDAAVVAQRYGDAVAKGFRDVIRGGTPVLEHAEAWLREGGGKGPLNPRTAAQYRSDLKAIAQWLQGIGVTTIEGVTKVVAGRYVTEQLVGQGIHWATANRKITAAGAYWRWLRKRAGVEGDPWAGQHLAKGSGGRTTEKSKRPFTSEEVRALLAGEADEELADVMRVAALTGMRLDEIYRLAVVDCAGGWFRVHRAKTAAGVRRVPIHSGLAAIVTRRVKGKALDAHLFHEAGPRVPSGVARERSMPVSKRFSHYRQTVGVHDRADGARHSRVDFHSWRRWFITEARNAGIDRAVVAAVVGHEAGNITDGIYHGGPSDDLLRACVEAVKLP